MRQTFIYQITRQETGECYIGISCHPEKRWSEHRADATHRPQGRLHRALAKYGAAAFTWEVIHTCPSPAAAKLAEMCLIYLREPAYNLTAGGDGCWGYVPTPEARAKVAAAKKGIPSPSTILLNKKKIGVPQTPEHIENRVSKFRGRPRCPRAIAKTVAANLGRKHTPDSRARNSAAQSAYQARLTAEQRRQATLRAREALAAKRAAAKAVSQ